MKTELETLCTERLVAVTGGTKKQQATKPRSPRKLSPGAACDRNTVLIDPTLGDAYIPDC
jgi:hypothetical protein